MIEKSHFSVPTRICGFTIALITCLLTFGPASLFASQVPVPSTQKSANTVSQRSPWSFHFLFGASFNMQDDHGGLLRKPDHIGNVTIASSSTSFAWELGVGYRFSSHIWFRWSYQLANLDFGTDSYTPESWDPLDPSTGGFETLQFGTACQHWSRFGILFGGTRKWRHGEWSYRIGPAIGPSYYTNLNLSQKALTAIGIKQVTTNVGILTGIDAEIELGSDRHGWTVGFKVPFGVFGADPKMNIETYNESRFESGLVHFAPSVVGITVSYRFR